MSSNSVAQSPKAPSNTFNVSDEVFSGAQRFNLELMATGGGFDFVWKKISGFARDTEHDIVLQDGMTGESPKTLKDDTNMVVFFDSDWTEFLELKFSTCEQAMQKMSDEVFLIKLSELIHDAMTKRVLDRHWANSLACAHNCKVVFMQLT